MKRIMASPFESLAKISPTTKRRLFDITAAVSLLLFHAVCVLWAYDFKHESLDMIAWRYYVPPHEGDYRSWDIRASSYSNTLRVDVIHDRYGLAYLDTLSPPQRAFWDTERPSGSQWSVWGGSATLVWEHHPPGFDAEYEGRWLKPDRYTTHWGFAVRTWLPAALFAIPPAVWLYRRLKTKRPRVEEAATSIIN